MTNTISGVVCSPPDTRHRQKAHLSAGMGLQGLFTWEVHLSVQKSPSQKADTSPTLPGRTLVCGHTHTFHTHQEHSSLPLTQNMDFSLLVEATSARMC